jgi:YidC/Oxa1 family membrane protein insertase
MDQIAERGPGWLRWLANLIANFLKFLHKYLPNYGLVIIVFSLILSLILTSIQQPLTRKGMEANLKMQEIQPQMEAIRKKYPNDMEAQRREMVKLQQEHGVNVFGGCIMWIPLLINMPILISLYNVLRYTLDMRNASFILWWKDLSLPDKYYVLPILMSVVMIVQSRFVKPPTPDESKMTEQQKQAQQTSKMMSYIMPVMMFFIFKGLPSGLVLYYTVYSIFSAFRQYSLQKKIKTKDTITK